MSAIHGLQPDAPHLQKILEQSLNVVCTIDAHGIFAYVSNASTIVWGYTPAELIGRHFLDLVHEEDKAETADVATRKTKGEDFVHYENRYIKKDGTIVIHTWSSTWDAANQCMYCVATDITALRTHEKILKANEEKYKHIFDSNPIPLFIYNFKTLQILECNAAALDKYGYTKEEFLQLTIKDIRPTEDIAEIESATQTEEAYGKAIHQKIWRHQAKDGRIIFFDITGRIIDYMGVRASIVLLNDVTEKIQAEQELEKNRQLLNEAERISHVGSWEYDLKSGDCIFSDEFFRILGYEPGGIASTADAAFMSIHPDDQPRANEAVQRSIQTGAPYDIEKRIIRPDGSIRDIRSQGRVIFDKNGHPEKLYGIFQDITERRQIENRIAGERNILRAIIDNIPDYVYVTDQSLKHVVNNKAILKLMGVNSEEETLHKTLFEFLPTEVAEKYIADNIQILKTGKGIFDREETLITKNGKKQHILTTKLPLKDRVGQTVGVVGISRDVTFLHKREREQNLIFQIITALGQNEQIHDALREVLSIISLELGFVFGEAWLTALDHQEILLSGSWAKDEKSAIFLEDQISNFKIGQGLVGQTWQDKSLTVYEDITHHPKFRRKAHAKKIGVNTAVGLPILFKDRVIGVFTFLHPEAVDVNNGFKRFMKQISIQISLDIERKKSEDELKKFFNYSPDLLTIAGLDGYFKKVNPAFHRILGYTEAELLSQPMNHFIHPDDHNPSDQILNSIKNGNNIVSFENRYLTKEGDIRWISWSSSILLEGQQLVFGYGKDITFRKTYENQLNELNQELKRNAAELAASNAELEQFAYIASHDLQEPLRMVTSFLTQLERKYQNQLDEKAQQYIYFAVDGAVRMRAIIQDLLEYSRVGKKEHKKELISLEKLVAEVIELNKTAVDESKAKIEIAALPTVTISKAPMQQVLQNLISNAIKYRRQDIAPHITVTGGETSDHWWLSIKDNGIGIEQEFFDKIFVLFQRLHTKDEFSGTGIGLAICKKIIDNLHGKIWVTSDQEEGSTFHIKVPK